MPDPRVRVMLVMTDAAYRDLFDDGLRARLDGLADLVLPDPVGSFDAPALPETRHLIDARRCALMRDGATLVNTARGALVDHAALAVQA